MKIRTRVKIAGALTVCVLLAYGAGVLHLDRTMGNLAQEIKKANEIVSKITILRNLTQDYLLYRTERAQRQWSALYDEVLHLLDSPEYSVLKKEYGLVDASQKLMIVGDTFSKLMTVQQTARGDKPEEGARRELQNRLATQLLLTTQDLLTRFFNLNETINGKLIATQRFISFVDILALLVLGILLISNAVFLQRSVVKPVLRLQEGAENIGRGDLDYKIGIDSKDEIGQLSRAFDRMTANLQEITVSRDDLAAEVEERKRAEGALRESEEHYRSLFDHMLDGFAYCRMHFEQNQPVDFTYLKVNESFATLTGLKNVVGKKVSEVIPGIREANPELFEIYGRVALTGKPERFEIYLDPLKMWLSVSVYSPQKDYFVAVFDVITARKRAEEETQRLLKAIQLEKDKLTALVNSISDEIWFADTRKKITLANPSALREFGLDSIKEIELEKFAASMEVYRADGSPRPVEEAPPLLALQGEHVRNLEEIVRTPATGELQHRQVSSSPVRDVEGNIIGSVSVVQDITERKQAEEKIKHLASFPQINPSPVLEIDFDGRITYVNPGAMQALEKIGPGLRPENFLPEDLAEIQAAAKEKGEHYFYREVTIRDAVFAENIYFAAPFEVLRIYSMNITALKRTLEDLERSNRDLEEFAYISSHDLQEPLRKIANFSEMLSERYRGRLDEDADRYLGYIAEGAKRMQALINDLLSYSRVGRADLPLSPVSMDEVLRGTLNDLQPLLQESQAQITHDPLPALEVNPYQMGQLLQNLLTNAVKFRGEQPPRIHITAQLDGGQWVFAVRDQGIGFDSQHAERIFKVFHRLHPKGKYQGTGIGLSICKKIAERHGGRCWAESQPGRGATFYFTIPA